MVAHRIGILGTGWGTSITLPALRAEGWEVTALWSRTEANASHEAAKLGVPFATTDVQAVIDRADVDALAIATPTPSHHDFVLRALASGKHVLAEKPMAVDMAEASVMLEAANRAGVTAMINFEYRFTPARLHVAQLLADGYIGEFEHASIELEWDYGRAGSDLVWRDQARLGGGVLNEHGSHYIDMLRQWLGEIRDISARLSTFAPDRRDPESGAATEGDAEDFWTASLTMAGGGVVTLSQSWVGRIQQGVRIRIAGSEGLLVFSEPETMPVDAPLLGARRSEELHELPRPPAFPPLPSDDLWRVGATRRIVREFTRGIEEGLSPTPNFEDGLRCQAVLDAARESDRTGRRIPIRLP